METHRRRRRHKKTSQPSKKKLPPLSPPPPRATTKGALVRVLSSSSGYQRGVGVGVGDAYAQFTVAGRLGVNIVISSQNGDFPWEDLAMFGYKLTYIHMKSNIKKIINNKSFFVFLVTSYLLNHVQKNFGNFFLSFWSDSGF